MTNSHRALKRSRRKFSSIWFSPEARIASGQLAVQDTDDAKYEAARLRMFRDSALPDGLWSLLAAFHRLGQIDPNMRPNMPGTAERWSIPNLPVPLAERALELGWAIDPGDPRVKRLAAGANGGPPILEHCHNLDDGSGPDPAPAYVPYGSRPRAVAELENYRKGESFQITIPGPQHMAEPMGARSVKPDGE